MIDYIPNYVIGFTGTREGMTESQKKAVHSALLYAISQGPTIAIHGDCIGADAQFDEICQSLHIETFCRPCTLMNYRANTSATILAEAEHPLTRNKKIVDGCSLLLATPQTAHEELRSGTWSTIRYARRVFKPNLIFAP